MEVNVFVKTTVSAGLIHCHIFGSAKCKVKILLKARTAYAQCRQQLGGSWAPDPSWQCQQPGSSATGSSNTAPAGDTSSGGGTGTVPTDQGNTSPSTNSGSTTSSGGGGGGSPAATNGDCPTASPPGGWDGVASTSVSA